VRPITPAILMRDYRVLEPGLLERLDLVPRRDRKLARFRYELRLLDDLLFDLDLRE
jgi:hypothetical protein